MKFIKLFTILLSCIYPVYHYLADELKLENNTEFNIYTGMFDFSDEGKKIWI